MAHRSGSAQSHAGGLDSWSWVEFCSSEPQTGIAVKTTSASGAEQFLGIEVPYIRAPTLQRSWMEEDLAGVVRAARNTAANYGRPELREAPALALFVCD